MWLRDVRYRVGTLRHHALYGCPSGAREGARDGRGEGIRSRHRGFSIRLRGRRIDASIGRDLYTIPARRVPFCPGVCWGCMSAPPAAPFAYQSCPEAHMSPVTIEGHDSD